MPRVFFNVQTFMLCTGESTVVQYAALYASRLIDSLVDCCFLLVMTMTMMTIIIIIIITSTISDTP